MKNRKQKPDNNKSRMCNNDNDNCSNENDNDADADDDDDDDSFNFAFPTSDDTRIESRTKSAPMQQQQPLCEYHQPIQSKRQQPKRQQQQRNRQSTSLPIVSSLTTPTIEESIFQRQHTKNYNNQHNNTNNDDNDSAVEISFVPSTSIHDNDDDDEMCVVESDSDSVSQYLDCVMTFADDEIHNVHINDHDINDDSDSSVCITFFQQSDDVIEPMCGTDYPIFDLKKNSNNNIDDFHSNDNVYSNENPLVMFPTSFNNDHSLCNRSINSHNYSKSDDGSITIATNDDDEDISLFRDSHSYQKYSPDNNYNNNNNNNIVRDDGTIESSSSSSVTRVDDNNDDTESVYDIVLLESAPKTRTPNNIKKSPSKQLTTLQMKIQYQQREHEQQQEFLTSPNNYNNQTISKYLTSPTKSPKKKQQQQHVGENSSSNDDSSGDYSDDEFEQHVNRMSKTNENGYYDWDMYSYCDSYCEDGDNTSLLQEMIYILILAVPTLVIQFSSNIPFTLTISYIGRNLDPIYTVGYSLATALGNITTNMLLLGVFSASDTLSPQAYGAENYNELGLIALRGVILGHAITVPATLILLFYMTPILVTLGQSYEASIKATIWYRIYVISLPATIILQVIWKFLSAQNILRPLVVISLICSIVIMPILLSLFGTAYGYLGTAAALAAVTIIQAILVPIYLKFVKPHHPQTWTGLTINNWKAAVDREKFLYFLSLSMGGILASLEWLYWEVVTILVGTISPIDLAIHTVSAQVTSITFNLGFGFMIAIATRIGNILPISVSRSKSICLWGSFLSYSVFMLSNVIVYTFGQPIIRLFTSDQDVIDGCNRVWIDVIIFMFNCNIFYVNSGIATGLGMQWSLGVITGVVLFGFGLPSMYYFAVVLDGGVEAAWRWIWPPYCLINIILTVIFFRADWEQISTFIRIREGVL